MLVSELPGSSMEKVELSPLQEQGVWQAAGRALAGLHAFAVGECFGPCGRDGACSGAPVRDAKEYVTTELECWTEKGRRAGYLHDDELAVIRTAHSLAPVFGDEHPLPCHRDYGPANWVVSGDGVWAGVIDFEFAYWDVRVADFSRYPNWEWMTRPDLLAAFFDGYGRCLTPAEEQQRFVAHVQYALSAIVWGCEHAFYGFAAEGRQAFKHLARLMG